MAVKKIHKPITHAIYIGGDPRNIDLIVGKIYRVLKLQALDRAVDLRVVDESGEDYLYPTEWFVPIDVPNRVKRILATMQID